MVVNTNIFSSFKAMMQMEGFAIKDFDHVNIANRERPTGDAILQQLIDTIKEKNLLIYSIVK
jgi:hypothetical protein